MGYMKQLYTELQEVGWKEEEIHQTPNELAWKMAGSKRVKEKVIELKEKGITFKNQYVKT